MPRLSEPYIGERRFRAAINRYFDAHPDMLERMVAAVVAKAEQGDVVAFRELADRQEGRASQEHTGPDGGVLQFERIERVIVEQVVDMVTSNSGATVLQLVHSTEAPEDGAA